MKHTFFSTTFFTVLLSLVFGGASGVFMTAMTTASLSDYRVQLTDQTRPLQAIDHTPKSFPNSYTDATNRFVDTTLPSIAVIYQTSKKGTYGFGRDAVVTSGVVVTSDGWIAIANVPAFSADLLSVEVKQTVYAVTNLVTDPVTNTTFLKIAAADLPVVGFGKAFDLTRGQQIFAVKNSGALVETSVRNQLWPQGTSIFSDVPSRRVVIASDALETGNATFDLSGSFVGFVQKQDVESFVLPVEDILPALSSLLEKKLISRPSLGLKYVDIAHAVGMPEKFKRHYEVGAYLTDISIIKKLNPTTVSGLKVGDIVLSLNGQMLDEAHGLDERLLAFRPGNEIVLEIDRLGKKQNIHLILGEYGK